MTEHQSRSRKLTYTGFKSYNSSLIFAFHHSFSNFGLRYRANHEPPLDPLASFFQMFMVGHSFTCARATPFSYLGNGWTARAAVEGVQGVQLHPIQKLGSANISFCTSPPQKKYRGALHRGRSGSHQYSLKF